MKFYHGTSIENAKQILTEGFVLGKKKTYGVSPEGLICVYAECEGSGFEYAVLNAQAAAAAQDSKEVGVAVMAIDIPDSVIKKRPDNNEEEYRMPCDMATEFLTGYYVVHDAYSPGTRLIILAHMYANGKRDVLCADLNNVDSDFLRDAERRREDFIWSSVNTVDQDYVEPSAYRFISKEET